MMIRDSGLLFGAENTELPCAFVPTINISTD